MTVLTRKDCIRIAEVFARSGLKGISVAPGFEGKMLLAASKLRTEERQLKLEEDGVEYEEKEAKPELVAFMSRHATKRELEDADRLIEAMRRVQLPPRTLRIIYSRAYFETTWSTLGKQLMMNRMDVKRNYEDGLYVLFAQSRDLIYRTAA